MPKNSPRPRVRLRPASVESSRAKRLTAPPPDRLLVTREQAAAILGGVSVSTVIRMEAAGRLSPIKLTAKPAGMTFYRADQVRALAGGRE